ncbi:MAG: TetR/AcrR family transcriptional regulator [Nocardioides sp.]|uniref:TetR/AcrR family transcriptional regulator n=1 Tax=Nocardioides sp. TaxID=35761 RepID=UPI0039E5504D
MQQTPERQRLLSLVADVILEAGMLDLSLSGIARRIGSNNRMLLYYFDSKERLLDEAAVLAADRFPLLHHVLDRLASPGDLEGRLRQAWRDISAAENLPFLRMFFQRFGTALRDEAGSAEFLRGVGVDWLRRVGEILGSEGYPPATAETAAAQLVATWRGLQFSLLSGVDRTLLDRAYDDQVGVLLASMDDTAARG